MSSHLVIVESPAKATTIKRFLGDEYEVKSCFGHIRDLVKKNLGIDIENKFSPQYEISPEKKKIVSELKNFAKKADSVLLASDEDREGEAIAWHLYETLKLKDENTSRIVFHEITKNAILEAIKHPRKIDMNLVYAQQARRILDRLVGFELSPILWKKIKPALSAGRVQSVAVRVIVEREREIIAFHSTSYYKLSAVFKEKEIELKADLSTKFNDLEETRRFLNHCKNADFTISNIETKPFTRHPAAPFTTSTLQQEASRKLRFSVSHTMSVAQKLYEAGRITYMRTDSLNLSNTALTSVKNEIEQEYGKPYVNIRKYKTKTKGAQEAHEAIRPTYFNNHEIEGTADEKRLYDLIWKRTVASQMSDAELEKTTITISISNSKLTFLATGEMIKFDGFLKVYTESSDEEQDNKENGTKGLLPSFQINHKLLPLLITGTEKYTLHPPRYTEASLVKKLEEQGIGRPSTYAPIISTIQQRGYVTLEDRQGNQRNYHYLTLDQNNTIKEEIKTEYAGSEKSKLFPTDIGMIVNDFLVEHFPHILDYNFTALIEKEFDEVAMGKVLWNNMIGDFYKPFHQQVENTLIIKGRNKGERNLGIDPETGKTIFAKMGKYGPIVQLGTSNEEEKPKFASLLKGQHLETISLEEALVLFKLPRNIGIFENEDVFVSIGKFGPYIKHKSSFYSLKKGEDDPFSIELSRAIEIIELKRKREKEKTMKVLGENNEISIIKGHWGPYISYMKKNYKLPKIINIESLTYEECINIINNNSKTGKKTRYSKQ